jgi:SnoaL-like protein
VTPYEELRALLQRYARAVDQRDVDGLAALFHPEATITGARGPQGLDEWLDTLRAPRAFPQSMHMLGDPIIELSEADGTAHLDCYAVVYQLGDQAQKQGDLTLGIRYADQAVLYEGHWVFRSRAAQTLWMR